MAKGAHNAMVEGRKPWKQKKNLKEEWQKGESDGRGE